MLHILPMSVDNSEAPWVSKFTHKRKFGNHVTLHRAPIRPYNKETNRDLKHRELNGRRRRFPTEADWAKGFVFGGENEV